MRSKFDIKRDLDLLRQKKDFMDEITWLEQKEILDNELLKANVRYQDEYLEMPKDDKKEFYRKMAIEKNRHNPWTVLLEYGVFEKNSCYKLKFFKGDKEFIKYFISYWELNPNLTNILRKLYWRPNGKMSLNLYHSNELNRFQKMMDICKKNKVVGVSEYKGSEVSLKRLF